MNSLLVSLKCLKAKISGERSDAQQGDTTLVEETEDTATAKVPEPTVGPGEGPVEEEKQGEEITEETQPQGHSAGAKKTSTGIHSNSLLMMLIVYDVINFYLC